MEEFGNGGAVWQRQGRAAAGLGFPGGSFHQISLMKWMEFCQTGRVGNEGHPCPAFPIIAIHGNYSLGVRPFHK